MVPLVLALLASAPSDEAIREAELQAAKALALWEAKEYVGAAEYFADAFELSGEPTQLRNAAKAYEAGGNTEKARATWTRYLEIRRLPASDRAEAEERLLALAVVLQPEPIAAELEPLAKLEPLAIAVEAPIPIEEPFRWEPWVLAGAGAVAAVIGGLLLYRSERDLDAFKAQLAPRQDGLITALTYEQAVAEEQRIESWRIGSSTVLGVGICAAIGGLAWWWFE